MAYSIQKADLDEHKDLLASLWDENIGELVPGRFPWLYENNPNGLPVVFLVKHEESQSFVGAVSLFSRFMFYKGQRIKTYICGDMVVKSQHRTLWPALALLKAAINQCQVENPCLLLTFPNAKSEPVALRVGFKVLGEHLDLVRLIATKRYFQRYIHSPLLTSLLALPFDVLLRLRWENNFLLDVKPYTTEVFEEFDHRFDELLKSLSEEYVFVGERDCRYSNWRTMGNPYNKNSIFSLISKENGKILGFISFYLIDKRTEIVDIVCCREEMHLSALLFLFGRYQRRQGSCSITIALASSKSQISFLNKCGFVIRRSLGKVLIYSSFEKDTFVHSCQKDDWYLTSADNDV